jgi:phenylpyruvate tautomerase PptA (4-oxalocrotonate tautomerase family)
MKNKGLSLFESIRCFVFWSAACYAAVIASIATTLKALFNQKETITAVIANEVKQSVTFLAGVLFATKQSMIAAVPSFAEHEIASQRPLLRNLFCHCEANSAEAISGLPQR